MASERAPTLRLTLFGTMQVEVNGVSLAGKCARKEMWLLALLALRLGKAVTREYLAGLLWPDNTEEQMLYYLRRSLSNIRAALGEAGDCLRIVKPRSLCLDAGSVSVDIHEFDRLVGQEETGALERAVGLRTAPLLEDCLEDWAHQERHVRETAYTRALDRLAEQAAGRFAWQEAARCAQLLIAADPLDEKAARTLMLAMARMGNHGAAMQAYRDVRLRLREEVNSEPDPETIALYESLRLEARQSAKDRPHSSAPTLARPSAAEKQASPVLPQRIGLSLTRLIGRESEQAEVLSLLSTARLITLTGTGGIGKTALSIEVARQAENRFAQGACLVELAPVGNPERLPDTVSQVLNIPDEAGASALDRLTHALADRNLLLVLDNCEHLLEGCTRLTGHLLTHCPGLKILASSRQALGLNGEIVWRVPSLPTPPDPATMPEAKGEPSYLLEFPSVQLFLERIKQSNPGFRITPQTLPVAGQICRQLDGIPLALELAAGRARVLPLTHIAARLDDRLRLLVGGSRAALPRQQTLRALLDWSYDLLTEDERALLHRLSVFSSGWTLEAAEHVCAGRSQESEFLEDWEVIDLLMALVEKSLVVYEEIDDAPRYRFLETVRQYAATRLVESGERETYRNRQRDYFLALAEEAKQQVEGTEQVHWLNRLETEHDNLRQALAFCLEDPQGVEKGLRLGGSLQRFWSVRGHLSEGRKILSALLARPSAQSHNTPRSGALNGAGVLAWQQGDYAAARDLYAESLEIRRASGDRRGIAASLSNLGLIAQNQGSYESARSLYTESLAIRRELGDLPGIAASLNHLGNVAYNQGDYDTAGPLYTESVKLHRELGNKRGIASSLVNVGNVACHQGDYAFAHNCYAECLELKRELGNKTGVAEVLEAFAGLNVRQARLDQAACLWAAAERLREDIHSPLPPIDQDSYDREVAAARQSLGEEAFSAAWTEGRSITMDESIARALEDSA